MTAPARDMGAARDAAAELVRLTAQRPTISALRLPTAMTLLEACGGDSIVALLTLAGVVNVALSPARQPFRPAAAVAPVSPLPQGIPE